MFDLFDLFPLVRRVMYFRVLLGLLHASLLKT